MKDELMIRLSMINKENHCILFYKNNLLKIKVSLTAKYDLCFLFFLKYYLF